MGFINLGSSIKYGPHGKKRKTKAFSTKSKRTKYNELLETQQRQYNQIVSELRIEDYPSYTRTTGDLSHMCKQEPMQYTGERKLLGIAVMHKSNLVPVFEEEVGEKGQYAKDLARMRR
jgi:hypothetical protein